ncbi:unnamed protein product [Sphagnum tenellum]
MTRIGFVTFSGEPLTMVPPTLDYGLLLQSLHQATLGVLKDGTAIGDGLALAVSHLKSSKAKSRVVILLTDGDNNLGQIDPATAGDLAQGYGIRVYTIAIGREGRVKMPIRHKTIFGNTVTSYQWLDNALNPELLMQIAKVTQGKFYRVTDESTLGAVFREIDQLEKSEIKSKEKIQYDEFFEAPLKMGGVILLIEQLLERGWWRPQMGSHEEIVNLSGLDVMFALDLSSSMDVEDVVPSRLKKTKHVIKALLNHLEGDRVGVTAFAASSHVVCPLTTDLSYVWDRIEILSPRAITHQGTDIGIGLDTALKAIERGAEEVKNKNAASEQVKHCNPRVNLDFRWRRS